MKIIKRILVFICVAMLINIMFLSMQNNPQRIKKTIVSKQQANEQISSSSEWLWTPGRAFTFQIVYMNFFSPGTARLVVQGKETYKKIPVLRLEALLQPNSFIKSIYDAHMSLASAVTVDDKRPVWYREKSVTPEKNKLKEILFDLDANIAERDGMKFAIPGDVSDPLSVFFNFLDSDFLENKKIVLELFSKEEVYEFSATPLTRKDGIFTVTGQVRRKDRSSHHGAKFTMWILDGTQKIPLLIKLITPAGFVYLRLIELQ